MMKRAVQISVILALCMVLTACGGKQSAAEPAVSPAAPAVSTAPGRQVGERYEGTIMLEGMEETVRYEHIRSDTVGIEMGYDYENFVRQSEAGRERIISRWDDPNNPQYYLELTYRPENAETAAASIAEELSKEYKISRNDAFMLDSAGSCIRIDASEVKGGGYMPDLLQMAYIIPASDGCRVALQHYYIEGAEGFGARFRNMMHTLTVIDRQEAPKDSALSLAGRWQTASMAAAADGSVQPEYYVWFTESEIVYGHVTDGQSAFDHADPIIKLSETAGGVLVQAKSSNGVQYSYQTCESDPAVLEYYETWREEDFPQAYRAGASLSKSG